MASGQWSDYAKTIALQWLLANGTPTQPAALYVCLFEITAADTQPWSSEVSVAGYSRQEITWNSAQIADGVYANNTTITFSPTADGSFRGIRVTDASTGSSGHTLFWQDLDQDYDFTAGMTIPIAPGFLQSGLINPA